MKTAIRFVEDHTVVRLNDGRIGWKGHNTKSSRRNLIVFADQTGRELPPNEEVEVIKYPAQLAAEYVQGDKKP